MLSVIGAVLIIGATATVGLSSVWRMRTRVRALTGLIAAVDTMKSEICDRLTPLPELVEQLTREAASPVDRLFHRTVQEMSELGIQSFYFLWKNAVEASRELELTEPERQTLIDLGRSLGRYDTEEQRGAFTYALRRLEGYLRKAEEERTKQSRVHAVLGIVAGVFVVIVLM